MEINNYVFTENHSASAFTEHKVTLIKDYLGFCALKVVSRHVIDLAFHEEAVEDVNSFSVGQDTAGFNFGLRELLLVATARAHELYVRATLTGNKKLANENFMRVDLLMRIAKSLAGKDATLSKNLRVSEFLEYKG